LLPGREKKRGTTTIHEATKEQTTELAATSEKLLYFTVMSFLKRFYRYIFTEKI
jgi:hypothetical protein